MRLKSLAKKIGREVGGVNVHVGAALGARDRRRLERLCRYVARPPIAQERLEVAPAGRVLLRFNVRGAVGRTLLSSTRWISSRGWSP